MLLDEADNISVSLYDIMSLLLNLHPVCLIRDTFTYRVTRQVEANISLTSIWGVPPAFGPLLLHKQAWETPQIDVSKI